MTVLLLVGCGQKWAPDPLHPNSAPAVVLEAQLAADVVTIDGVLDGIPQDIDIDRGPDDRYGFRYKVVDANADVLYERSTTGPSLVESFLAYYSQEAGVDLLAGIPTFGRFPLVVPLLPTADHVLMEVRDETGEWVQRGGWDYANLDAPRVVPEVVPVGTAVLHAASVPSSQALDVVVVGDGYTADQLDLFAASADKVAEQVLTTEPFASHADRITVTRVDVASNESGASFDCPTCGYVDNAFGSLFPVELVNRITGGNYPNRPMFQAEQWKVAQAIEDVPWDAVVVLVNSQGNGAMAVHYASVTEGAGDVGPTAVHELGHAFGMLGDEYVADACVRAPGIPLPENITSHGDDPPWAGWVEPDTELPTPDGVPGQTVGAFLGAWNCPDLYRPKQECRMNDGHGAFCEVCTELLERRLMRFGDPATDVRIDGRAVIVEGALPDTEVVVEVDGVEVSRSRPDRIPELPRDAGTVEVHVNRAPDTVRRDPTGDLRETWTFESRPWK